MTGSEGSRRRSRRKDDRRGRPQKSAGASAEKAPAPASTRTTVMSEVAALSLPLDWKEKEMVDMLVSCILEATSRGFSVADAMTCEGEIRCPACPVRIQGCGN